MPQKTIQPLSPNSPLMDLNQDNDSFGAFEKADFISNLLLDAKKVLGENKMIVLYGGWGSGKSTTMLSIKKRLEDENFPVVFFEAWKYEKDNNLPLSLIAAISEILPSAEKDELKRISLSVFKSLVSSFELELKILGAKVKFSPDKGIQAYDREIEKVEKAYSSYEHIKEFEEKFKQIEKSIIESKQNKWQPNNKKLVIFIDDLDRCEPEHTLGLLTAIKLFFTYGSDTIFVCGVDKDAIKNALITKYGDTIKAEEYLEKVFDISFTMPEPISLQKIIGKALTASTYTESPYSSTVDFIDEFFRTIEFTNARHVKKVLNKFELVKAAGNASIASPLRAIVPPNLPSQNDKWEIVFTLYFIILFEFHYDKFVELESLEIKKTSHVQNIIEKTPPSNTTRRFSSVHSDLESLYPNISTFSLKDVELDRKANMWKLLLLFIPKESENRIELNVTFDQIPKMISHFDSDKNKILVKFCSFLFLKLTSEPLNSASTFLIWNYFKMARTMF